MGRKVYFTDKQERQIISFFENSHQMMVDPNNIDNSGVIALFRVCRDYCRRTSGGFKMTHEMPSTEEKAAIRAELMNNLDKLSIRYYERI